MRKRRQMNLHTNSDTIAISKNKSHDLIKKSSPSNIFSILAASYYIATSVLLTSFNKLLFSHYPKFDAPFLLLSQSLTTIIILCILNGFNRFQFPNLFSWNLTSFKTYLPLYVSNVVMLLSALLALQFTTLLMYNTLRRTSMIFVVIMHSSLNRTKPDIYTIGATVLVTIGAFIAGSTDLAFDPVGYALAFIANFSTAVYLVLIKRVRDNLALSNLQLLFVNAIANLPVLSIIIAMFPPKGNLLIQLMEVKFSLYFFFSCFLAMLINHATFVNTTVNDAIAQSIAAQLKDVVLLGISYGIIDKASQRAKGNIPGVFVGFLGSLVYGIGKMITRQSGLPNNQNKQDVEEDKLDKNSHTVEKTSLVTNSRLLTSSRPSALIIL